MKSFLRFVHSCDDAATNMALDEAMLTYCGINGAVLLRFYSWSEPALTFGYSQKRVDVLAQPGAGACCCVRRITGGGVVDHRGDLTYALTMGLGTAAFRLPAQEVYRLIHSGVAEAMEKLGIAADLMPCQRDRCSSPQVQSKPTVRSCFTKAEPFDVIEPGSGKKLAGAAMKRDRRGLLIQGSIDCREMPDGFKLNLEEAVAMNFESKFEVVFGPAVEVTKLRDHCAELGLVGKYASPRWNELR